MKATVYVTDQTGKRLEKTIEKTMQFLNTDVIEEQGHPGDVEAYLVNIHGDVEFQTFGGMGGSFNDTSASVWDTMPEDKKEEFTKAYFDKTDGIGYTFGRLTIGSCDFSKEDYT